MLRVEKFLNEMRKLKLGNVTAKRLTLLGQPLNTSLFGYIDSTGCPYGLGYLSEEKAFVFISTSKRKDRLRAIAKGLTEKEKSVIPKTILDALVDVASTQTAKSILYWYKINN